MTIAQTGQNIGSLDIAFGSATSDVSITATSSATGNTCVSTGPFSIVNPGNYWVKVWVPYLTIGTTNLDVELFQGSSSSGTFLTSLSGHMTASQSRGVGAAFAVRLNLAVGTNNLTVTAFVDAGTGHFGAGNGATGNAPNAYIRVISA